MKDFDIRVRTVAGSKFFHVSPKVIGKNTRYDIWEDNHLLFSLESSNGTASDSLTLTEEFSDKEIYPGFVHAVSDVIHSSENVSRATEAK